MTTCQQTVTVTNTTTSTVSVASAPFMGLLQFRANVAPGQSATFTVGPFTSTGACVFQLAASYLNCPIGCDGCSLVRSNFIATGGTTQFNVVADTDARGTCYPVVVQIATTTSCPAPGLSLVSKSRLIFGGRRC